MVRLYSAWSGNPVLNIQQLPSAFRIEGNGESSKIISELKTKKGTSHDGISNEIIKCRSPVIEPYLVELFNACLRDEKFPAEMGIAKVVLFENILNS